MEAFAETSLAIGVNAEAMHRIATISSAVFTALPHAGTILTTFPLIGLTHKNAFKYSFLVMTLTNLFALITVLIVGILFY